MKKSSKILVVALAAALLGGGVAAVKTTKSKSAKGPAAVKVSRSSIVDKALAVGTIEPEVEISIKSKVSGVVKQRFVNPGDFVEAGAPLLEIRPDPTPLELADARRQVELRDIELANLKKELDRQASLQKAGLLSQQNYDTSQRSYDEAALQEQMAKERLALIEKGHVTIADQNIESVVTAPIAGYVLEKKVEVGDPVVALGSYQEGTVLLTMADMKHLLFRGKVDEIDVGRLHEGLPVELKVGALPTAHVEGSLTKISLKAKKEENATSFPVEISLVATGGAVLRAGYSASADIIIQRRDSVLTVPERVVTLAGDSASVQLKLPDGRGAKRAIKTGLSDAINVEILSGLVLGDEVLEKPAKTVQ
jgi:HlyD family secretion protein